MIFEHIQIPPPPICRETYIYDSCRFRLSLHIITIYDAPLGGLVVGLVDVQRPNLFIQVHIGLGYATIMMMDFCLSTISKMFKDHFKVHNIF